MTTLDQKLLRKMLCDASPLGWLAAADWLEEQGDHERAETVRLRAERVLEVAEFLATTNAQSVGEHTYRSESPSSLGGLQIRAMGGHQILLVFIARFDQSRDLWSIASCRIHARRNKLARDDYRFRRAAELVDSIVALD